AANIVGGADHRIRVHFHPHLDGAVLQDKIDTQRTAAGRNLDVLHLAGALKVMLVNRFHCCPLPSRAIATTAGGSAAGSLSPVPAHTLWACRAGALSDVPPVSGRRRNAHASKQVAAKAVVASPTSGWETRYTAANFRSLP